MAFESFTFDEYDLVISVTEINKIYDLEIDRIISEVKKKKAKKILLQFPEGLKMYSQAIADEIDPK